MRESIVITGHTGLVGKHLWPRLAQMGAPLVLVNSRGASTYRAGSEPRLEVGDVFDHQGMLPLFETAKACVHLAAAHSTAVSDGVAGAMLRNALLTDYFASLAAQAEVATFIYASGAAVYYHFADPSCALVDESTPLHPDARAVREVMENLDRVKARGDFGGAFAEAQSAFGPGSSASAITSRAGYAYSKLIGEFSIAKRLAGRRNISLRLTNVLGHDDLTERIVPKFIRVARSGGSATVFDWTRNFIWIDDLISIITRALEGAGPSSGAVNAFTPGNTISLWDLTQLVNRIVGPPGGDFVLDEKQYEPHLEFSTRYPEMLPQKPVSIEEAVLRLYENR